MKTTTMQPFDLHPEFYNQPIWLTQEEKENPIVVIKQFFDDVKLIEVRHHLATMVEVCITCPNNFYEDSQKRDTVLYFCKQLEKMVEAATIYQSVH